jgi:hypothetical protein
MVTPPSHEFGAWVSRAIPDTPHNIEVSVMADGKYYRSVISWYEPLRRRPRTKSWPLPYPRSRYRGAVSGNALFGSAVPSNVAYWG